MSKCTLQLTDREHELPIDHPAVQTVLHYVKRTPGCERGWIVFADHPEIKDPRKMCRDAIEAAIVYDLIVDIAGLLYPVPDRDT